MVSMRIQHLCQCGTGSRISMTKNCKFPMEDVKATEETCSPKKRINILDPDPDQGDQNQCGFMKIRINNINKNTKKSLNKVKLNMSQNQDKGTAIPKVYIFIVPVPYLYQCCGSGSGIRCLFDPWTRIRDPNPYFLELSDKFLGKKF